MCVCVCVGCINLVLYLNQTHEDATFIHFLGLEESGVGLETQVREGDLRLLFPTESILLPLNERRLSNGISYSTSSRARSPPPHTHTKKKESARFILWR